MGGDLSARCHLHWLSTSFIWPGTSCIGGTHPKWRLDGGGQGVMPLAAPSSLRALPGHPRVLDRCHLRDLHRFSPPLLSQSGENARQEKRC
jgi:hypothetical protein